MMFLDKNMELKAVKGLSKPFPMVFIPIRIVWGSE
jgi:hypothetical protein